MVLFLAGIPIGIATSLFSWWILWRLLGPRGVFSPWISEGPDVAQPGKVRYRAKFLSTGRRGMMDVTFSASLFVPNVEPDGGQALIDVPLFNSSTPKIGGRRKERDSRKTVLSSRHRVVTLVFSDISTIQLARIGPSVRSGLAQSRPGGLIAVMRAYPGSTLVLSCTASDSWTGARRAFISNPYSTDSIRCAVFARGPSFGMVEAFGAQEREVCAAGGTESPGPTSTAKVDRTGGRGGQKPRHPRSGG